MSIRPRPIFSWEDRKAEIFLENIAKGKTDFHYDSIRCLIFRMTNNRITMTDWHKIQVGSRVFEL